MNLADRLGEHARDRPGAVAVIENDRSTDFRGLDLAVWRAAAWLRQEGIREGDVVALAMGDSTLHLAVGLGLARMGAVQLCLALREAAPDRRRLLDRHRPVALVTESTQPASNGIRTLHPDPAWLEPSGEAPDLSARAPGGERPWIIQRTSGTTGLPKAVLQTHAMYAARRELGRGPLSIGPEDRYFAALSMDFGLGYKLCLDALWVGATVIIGAPALPKPDDFLRAVTGSRATYAYLTPSYLHWLVAKLPSGPPVLPGLRVLRSGSMELPERVRKLVLERVSPRLLLSYGINDIDCGVTQADAVVQQSFPGSVGAPRPGVELQLVDEKGRVLGPGQVGQVRIRIQHMPAGYLDDPEATAKGFRDGWFHPGDLGLLSPEGMLTLKGRVDDLMNNEGIKVLPAEIEEALLAHSAVAEAAAFPVPTERNQHRPVAAVVLRAPVASDELMKWCLARLGPRAPRLVLEVPAMPRNDMGKVLKKDLAMLARSRLK